MQAHELEGSGRVAKLRAVSGRALGSRSGLGDGSIHSCGPEMSQHESVTVSHLLLRTGSLSLSFSLSPSQLLQNWWVDENTPA